MSTKYRHERKFLVHPHIIFLSLLIAGVIFLFLAFSGSYIYSRVQAEIPPIKLPILFYFNTLVLLSSSWTLMKCKQFYQDDDTQKYQFYLWFTLLLSLMFLGLQIFAWSQLINTGVILTQDNMASFVYLVSAVHFAHVIIGIPFLALFIYTAYKRMQEPVSVLVYYSDPAISRKLRLLTIYWHFLDALWLYLVLFFAVNYLIQ